MGSFVENVNKLSLNLDTIVKANSMFDDSILPVLQEVAGLDLQEITEDLKKGNYLGTRKIDIALSLNNTSTTTSVSYSGVTILLTSGVSLSMPFLNGEGNPLELTSHADIKNYIANHALYAQVLSTELTVEESVGTTPTLIRFRDADGGSSNVERVELSVYLGDAINLRPTYFWAQTTSSLQTIANRVGDIIALGSDIDKIIVLSNRIDEMLELQNSLTELMAIHTDLTEIEGLYSNLPEILNADASAATATAQATIATTKANEIKNVSVEQTITGASGTLASVLYNSTTGKFTFVVPQGTKGDKGDSFDVKAVGLFAQRSNYNTQPQGFSFLATDQAMIYFKNSATSGDWSAGSPFGKGDKGDTGVSITGIARTTGNGSAGTTDTYTIYLDNATTSTFNVYNGANGAVMSVAGRSGDVVLTTSDIGGLDTALGGKSDTTHTHTALTGLTVTGLKETSVAMPANDINLATGNLFTKTISGATTLTVSNAPTSGTVGYFILQLTNGGSATVTWFSGVKWAGGTAPTLTASGKDILSFYTIDAGTTWNCVSIQKDAK